MGVSNRRATSLRGFSLIEVMVASVISLIVISAATALAFGLMRASTTAKSTAQVNTRIALAHSFFNANLSNAGYLWRVDHQTGAGESTATFGEGYSAITSGGVFPIQICDALQTGCATPVAANPDKLIAIVPRDDILDAVRIEELAVPPLDADCTSLGTATEFEVTGDTSLNWNSGDLILISSIGHTTLASMSSSFSSGASSDGGTLSRSGFIVDLGPSPGDIELDDGARTTACDARRSLINAKVIRVKLISFRLQGEELQHAEALTEGQVSSLTWVGLLRGVDDLQFQFDLAMFPEATDSTGTARTCSCNVSDIFDGSTFTAAGCPLCTTGKRLNGDANDDEVYRLLGLRIGIVVRGDTQTQGPVKSWAGLFDRSTTNLATDSHIRRKSTIYLGLPNASTF